MKTNKLIALAFSAAILMTACTKTGPTGPAGTNGTNGANGATGPMGNANVKDTVYTLAPAAWTPSTAYEYATVIDNQITTSILSNGAVLAFWSPNGGSGWDVLNWSSLNPTGYIFAFNVTGTQLGFYFSGGGTPNSVFGGCILKIVCMTSQVMERHPNTNWKDINQVNAVIAEENGINKL
jgi:hypothetical protein